jgi:hypothetical protein
MSEFKFTVAMDIRAYGVVKVEAEGADAAIALLTPELMGRDFEPHGSGSDYDFSNPRSIWVEKWECEDTGEEDEYAEIDIADSPEGMFTYIWQSENLDIVETHIKGLTKEAAQAEWERQCASEGRSPHVIGITQGQIDWLVWEA